MVSSVLDYLGLSRRPKPIAARRRDGAGPEPDFGATVAVLHADEPEVGPLNAEEDRRLHRIKIFGATGSILLLIGSLGTGAIPVSQNPVAGMRLLSLPSRMFGTALTLSISGTLMLVVAWLLIGRFAVGRLSVEVFHGSTPARRMTRRQADHTLLLWIAPIIIAPPLLSKDVYSYLAQSAIAYIGKDPYTVSPLNGLPPDHPLYELAGSVPNIWKDTPAPYGPLFLWLGEHITAIAGDNITLGIFLHRMLALVGVAMIVWALPRLAHRCGVSPIAALWLGAMNPLVILHLVGGIHNESLMLGMMLVGLELGLAAVDSARSLHLPGRPWLPSGTGWLLIAGAGVIAMSSMIKATSIIALGFLGIALARRWGATLPSLRHTSWRHWWARSRDSVVALAKAAGVMGVVAAVVIVGICTGTGLGFGWTGTLSTGDIVRSWMSMPTALSVGAGRGGLWLGLGDHTQAILEIVRPLAQLIAAAFIVRWLLAALGGRIHPIGALGISMATIVVFSPFTQAWYLLWAVIPLAAWASDRWFRIGAIASSALIATVVMPTSSNTTGIVVAQGLLAAIMTAAILTALFFEERPRWLPSLGRSGTGE
ncbi:polyprenol phosphomannose-dependent alpha 1,6 mannosyltransferase MptB [Gordonia sp. X0973]|uniref:polyprenol phosphomannose-dependent alpha 1,6 mannosyltransferase MptB n=1 Tax=Gordonia sp. X0973 TaxID=2742602 RepID=UPI000F51D4B7|nr:polyprenol phosphomannose-dependent alpha 1,6 mannosyltransferase MptB [Gordonia sp. X0973]QKT07403.1 polyprenol phosphomannose-dependent alpha 1,6 mannosyltransferase MptB [Gordonia sp. X0973]